LNDDEKREFFLGVSGFFSLAPLLSLYPLTVFLSSLSLSLVFSPSKNFNTEQIRPQFAVWKAVK